MTATAGFRASLKMGGASSAVVDQGMTQSSGQIYYTTTASQNAWDPTVLATFEDNGSPVAAADIESVDYKMGKVTFDSGYVVTGPVTMSGNYLEVLDVAFARAYSLSVDGELFVSSVFGDAWLDREGGRNDVAFTFEDLSQGLDDLDAGAGTEQLHTILTSGTVKLFETCADKANETTCWRIWALLDQQSITADVSALLGSNFSGQGALPGFAESSASYGDPEA